jgi:hypothetical protein
MEIPGTNIAHGRLARRTKINERGNSHEVSKVSLREP